MSNEYCQRFILVEEILEEKSQLESIAPIKCVNSKLYSSSSKIVYIIREWW